MRRNESRRGEAVSSMSRPQGAGVRRDAAMPRRFENACTARSASRGVCSAFCLPPPQCALAPSNKPTAQPPAVSVHLAALKLRRQLAPAPLELRPGEALQEAARVDTWGWEGGREDREDREVRGEAEGATASSSNLGMSTPLQAHTNTCPCLMPTPKVTTNNAPCCSWLLPPAGPAPPKNKKPSHLLA